MHKKSAPLSRQIRWCAGSHDSQDGVLTTLIGFACAIVQHHQPVVPEGVSESLGALSERPLDLVYPPVFPSASKLILLALTLTGSWCAVHQAGPVSQSARGVSTSARAWACCHAPAPPLDRKGELLIAAGWQGRRPRSGEPAAEFSCREGSLVVCAPRQDERD